MWQIKKLQSQESKDQPHTIIKEHEHFNISVRSTDYTIERPRQKTTSTPSEIQANKNINHNGETHRCTHRCTHGLPGEAEWLQAVIGLHSGTMENTGTITTSWTRHKSSIGLEHRQISTYNGRYMNFRPIPQRMRHIQWIHKFGKSRNTYRYPSRDTAR